MTTELELELALALALALACWPSESNRNVFVSRRTSNIRHFCKKRVVGEHRLRENSKYANAAYVCVIA